MSRANSRARKRRARFEETRAELARLRDQPEAFAALLMRLAASSVCVWPVAEAAAGDTPLDDDERAMVATAVAPKLAQRTPNSVGKRHARGRDEVSTGFESQVAGISPAR